MTAQIAAIETTYAGHRFRSRLEARWAVFFDALETRWMYEPQGYDIEGSWYLPDFWLPDIGCWVEVKGRFPDGGWAALCEASEGVPLVPDGLPFGEYARPTGLLLLGEIPDVEHAERATHVLLGYPGMSQAVAFRGSVVLLRIGHLIGNRHVVDPAPFLRSAHNVHLARHPGVADAYDRARRARFEHGESG